MRNVGISVVGTRRTANTERSLVEGRVQEQVTGKVEMAHTAAISEEGMVLALEVDTAAKEDTMGDKALVLEMVSAGMKPAEDKNSASKALLNTLADI